MDPSTWVVAFLAVVAGRIVGGLAIKVGKRLFRRRLHGAAAAAVWDDPIPVRPPVDHAEAIAIGNQLKIDRLISESRRVKPRPPPPPPRKP